jgi:hypothetical protein
VVSPAAIGRRKGSKEVITGSFALLTVDENSPTPIIY